MKLKNFKLILYIDIKFENENKKKWRSPNNIVFAFLYLAGTQKPESKQLLRLPSKSQAAGI